MRGMIRIFAICVGIVFLFWLAGLFWFMNIIPDHPPEISDTTAAAVVLTGGEMRLERGLQLLQEGTVKHLLISGVSKGSTLKQFLKLYPQSKTAITHMRDVIVLDDEATTTIENAIQTRQWIQQEQLDSIRLVTASYHIPRSMFIFSRYLPETTIYADPVFPKEFEKHKWLTDFNTFRLIMLEYLKYLYTWATLEPER
jgi:uncharacterized SAM-binding protein YcdF (DUF218 family)